MAKFEEVVKSLGVKAEDIVTTSKLLEGRNAQGRLDAFKRRAAVKAGKKTAEAGVAKPKLGRGLTLKAVHDAIAGAAQSRVVRAKLLRAINALAKRNKKSAMSSLDLFGETKRRKGKAPTKKAAA